MTHREQPEHVHEEQRRNVPGEVDLPPTDSAQFNSGDVGRDVEIDRGAGGGIEGKGEVQLHAGEEGLREVPAGESAVDAAERDFMNLDRSRHA